MDFEKIEMKNNAILLQEYYGSIKFQL